jgi:hypothetical protein
MRLLLLNSCHARFHSSGINLRDTSKCCHGVFYLTREPPIMLSCFEDQMPSGNGHQYDDHHCRLLFKFVCQCCGVIRCGEPRLFGLFYNLCGRGEMHYLHQGAEFMILCFRTDH